MSLNLLRAMPHRPARVHMHKATRGEPFAGPVCGQVAMDGTSHPRTPHTWDASRVTCVKCRKALDKAAATTSQQQDATE